MSFNEILIILLMGLSIWYWLDGIRAKEIACQYGKSACEELGVIFLDETVTLDKIRIHRDSEGHLSFYRLYNFEFTSDGSCRYDGELTMLGKRFTGLSLDPHRMPHE